MSDGLLEWETLGGAFICLPHGESEGARYSPTRAAVLENVPPGKKLAFSCGTTSVRSTYSPVHGRRVQVVWRKGPGFWRRLSFDKPCPTLPASPIQKATSLCHPDETQAAECAGICPSPAVSLVSTFGQARRRPNMSRSVTQSP